MEKTKIKEGDVITDQNLESQDLNTPEEKELMDFEGEYTIEKLRKLISQGVARLDFEKNEFGNPRAVKVTRTLDGTTVFYSEDIRDINSFLK